MAAQEKKGMVNMKAIVAPLVVAASQLIVRIALKVVHIA